MATVDYMITNVTVASVDIGVSNKVGEISDLGELTFSVLKNRKNTIEPKDSGVYCHEKIGTHTQNKVR